MGRPSDRMIDLANSTAFRFSRILLRWLLTIALSIMPPVAVTSVTSNFLRPLEEHETAHEVSFRFHSESVRLERSTVRALQCVPRHSSEPGTASKGFSQRVVCRGHRLSNGLCAPLLC